ncbi:MAG: bphA [Ilumatobacteraceae bacterium]|nr:bphA [Ilumatobacteraceae bacterium]
MIADDLLRSVFDGERGLPGEAFVDERWFSREANDLFRGGWTCIAFDHDVAAVGDVHPVTIAGVPLVVVCDGDAVRVFHNVCSHRGAMLVDEPQCGLRRLTCPYHRWIYGLDGALQHTHHAGGFRIHVTPEADPAQLGLVEVRSAVWHRFVFVDLSGTAEPFDTFIEPTADRLAPVDFDLLRHDCEFDGTFQLASNWKTIVENFVESYHVPQVHPALQTFNPMADHYQILGGRAYAGQGGLAYGSAANAQPMPGDELPVMDTLVRQTFSYESLWVFPNLILVPVANTTFAILVLPDAAGATTERIAFWFNGDESLSPVHAVGRADVVASILQVNREDIAIVESCQRGRRSPAFVGGVFMTGQEATSMLVQRIIAGRILEAAGIAVDMAGLPVVDIHHDRSDR